MAPGLPSSGPGLGARRAPVGERGVIHSPAALWKQRQRLLPAVLAVCFSALLVIVQFGLVLGFFSLNSLPIDHSRADLWVADPTIQAYDLGQPIDEDWRSRVASEPEVVRTETYLQTTVAARRPGVKTVLFLLVGSRQEADALGAVQDLTPPLRARLSAPDTVVIDETSLHRLGFDHPGGFIEISGRSVQIVGILSGAISTALPLMFCSLETARRLFRGLPPDQTTYILARCRDPEDAPRVARRLRERYRMAAFTSAEFSKKTRLYWLTRTKGGLATGWSALLGLIVGGVITSQTLYSATLAYRREFAVLRAFGIPRRRLTGSVLILAFWVGCIGVVAAVLLAFGLVPVAAVIGLPQLLPPGLLAATAAATLLMAVLASVLALRSVQRIDPAELLH